MTSPPPPSLADDLIGEILLRLPPADPACLVRASLVCKPWRRLLTDRGFLHRYRAFHRTPPFLGFFRTEFSNGRKSPRFVPTAKASPIPQPETAAHGECRTVDCRHGFVLLKTVFPSSLGLAIWDPVTNEWQHLPIPLPVYPYFNLTAAILCASDDCDHLNCHGRPFRVVLVGNNIDPYVQEDCALLAAVYSSETRAWSATVSLHLCPGLDSYDSFGPSLLLRDVLYFNLKRSRLIVMYDLIRGVLSVIKAPPLHEGSTALAATDKGSTALAALEDGTLGVAVVEGSSLHLWSRQTGPNGVAGWVQGRVIKLDVVISSKTRGPSTRLGLVGFAEGAGFIFINTRHGIFTVELKSGRITKIGEGGISFHDVFPFMSFYTPGRATSRLEAPVRMESDH